MAVLGMRLSLPLALRPSFSLFSRALISTTMPGEVYQVAAKGFGTGTNELYDRCVHLVALTRTKACQNASIERAHLIVPKRSLTSVTLFEEHRLSTFSSTYSMHPRTLDASQLLTFLDSAQEQASSPVPFSLIPTGPTP